MPKDNEQPRWQVVEKDDFGTDWHQVRYDVYAMERFNTEEEAVEAAKKYLTHINCDNALTKAEKQSGAEAFMFTSEGCFLGALDGKDWYITYPKDILKSVNGKMTTVHTKGDPIEDPKYFELEGKTQVAVRPIPGT